MTKLYAAQDHSLKHQLGKYLGLFVCLFSKKLWKDALVTGLYFCHNMCCGT